MKLARVGIIAAAILAVATVAFAQKPDFSGTWTPDTAAAAPAGTGGGGQRGGGMAGPMTVKQDATTLTIERTAGENKVTTVYKLDGTETENKVNMRGNEVIQKTSAKFDGAKLILTTKSAGPDGQERVQSQTWTLEGGNLVIERAGREGAPVKTTYKKTT